MAEIRRRRACGRHQPCPDAADSGDFGVSIEVGTRPRPGDRGVGAARLDSRCGSDEAKKKKQPNRLPSIVVIGERRKSVSIVAYKGCPRARDTRAASTRHAGHKRLVPWRPSGWPANRGAECAP